MALRVYNPSTLERKYADRTYEYALKIFVSRKGHLRFSTGFRTNFILYIGSKVEFIQSGDSWYMGVGVGFSLRKTSGGESVGALGFTCKKLALLLSDNIFDGAPTVNLDVDPDSVSIDGYATPVYKIVGYSGVRNLNMRKSPSARVQKRRVTLTLLGGHVYVSKGLESDMGLLVGDMVDFVGHSQYWRFIKGGELRLRAGSPNLTGSYVEIVRRIYDGFGISEEYRKITFEVDVEGRMKLIDKCKK